MFARVRGFLSYCLAFDIDFLPCSPHPKLYVHSDFSFQETLTVYFFFKRHTGRIPDVHSVCFENQQATDCYKWD